jgi:hypothetical protein
MKEPAPYTLVYSTDLRQGKVDYQKETMEVSFMIYLLPDYSYFTIPQQVVNQVRTGLEATGRTKDWGLNWPKMSVAGTTPFTSKSDQLNVTVELLNDNKKVIGRQNIALPYGWNTWVLTPSGALSLSPVPDRDKYVTFTAIKADDITDKLNINIAGINGQNAQTASKNKRISVIPFNEYVNIKKSVYAIGDLGPAGGIVFYDRGYSQNGWRYLEAAPKTSEKELPRSDAIRYCMTLNIVGDNPWHLPNKEELNLMYTNLHMKGLGQFSNSAYWSSLEDDGNHTWVQRFSDGSQEYGYPNHSYSVRAVRAF